MKTCPRCSASLPLESFCVKRSARDGRQTACRKCSAELHKSWASKNHDAVIKRQREWYATHRLRYLEEVRVRNAADWRPRMIVAARTRAKSKGVPFNLAIDDLVIPERCPVLGVPLTTGVGTQHDSSPSLDRIVPSLGYVRGNVVIMSLLANRVKSNATPDQLMLVARWLSNRMAS